MFIEREYTYKEVDDVAQLLQAAAERCTVMAFEGPIGAGKTTLIRAFLKSVGVTEPIVSPTFTYVSCYKTAAGRAVYHFDLYRIESAAQFESMGFLDSICEPGALIIIEWPAVIASLLTMPVCAITLDYAQLIEHLTKQYITSTIHKALLESLVAEQAARFVSMDSATRNAEKILEATKLKYNKLRQAKITKELLELADTF